MLCIEMAAGKVFTTKRPLRYLLFMVTGIMAQVGLSGPVIGSVSGYLVVLAFPENSGIFFNSNFFISFPLIWLSIEMCHYWIHRAAHEYRWMWKLHRTHHSAQDLNKTVLYRMNIFWVFLLPQVWFGPFCFYFGLGAEYLTAVLCSFAANMLTHSVIRWDLWLREKMPWSEPLWWVIERVITLPDTHHAHHAYGKDAHPNGNYAVTFFIFDVIFGTAKIPNRKQDTFGLPISLRLPWAEELFWPVVKQPLLPKPEKK